MREFLAIPTPEQYLVKITKKREEIQREIRQEKRINAFNLAVAAYAKLNANDTQAVEYVSRVERQDVNLDDATPEMSPNVSPSGSPKKASFILGR